jgi:hypothetical protein
MSEPSAPVPSAARGLPSIKIRSARGASAAPPAAAQGARRASSSLPAPAPSLADTFSFLFASAGSPTVAGCEAALRAALYQFFMRGGLCSVLAGLFQALAVCLLTFTSAAFWVCLSYTPFMAFPGIVSLMALLAMLLLSFGPVLAAVVCGVHGCEVGRCFRAGMLAFVGVLSLAAIGVFVSFEERRYLVLTQPPTLIVATSVCMVAGFVSLWVAALLNVCTVCAARGWCCAPPYSAQGEEEEEEDMVARGGGEGREGREGSERVELEVRD